jgi:hypothetical protein
VPNLHHFHVLFIQNSTNSYIHANCVECDYFPCPSKFEMKSEDHMFKSLWKVIFCLFLYAFYGTLRILYIGVFRNARNPISKRSNYPFNILTPYSFVFISMFKYFEKHIVLWRLKNNMFFRPNIL